MCVCVCVTFEAAGGEAAELVVVDLELHQRGGEEAGQLGQVVAVQDQPPQPGQVLQPVGTKQNQSKP